ncbi:MAG: SLC13 family permease [Nitrososphaeria archaeon]|nr:SLC13 family permease [Nitrososphaeria archaeon]
MKESFKAVMFGVITLLTIISCILLNLSREQVVAVTIFASKTAATLLFWRFRLAIGFVGLALLFLFGVLDVAHFIEFAGLDVIIFLIGMMIVIGHLEERGFFEYVLAKIINLARGNPVKTFYLLMISSFIMAALVDEVTSILFVTALVLRVASYSGVSPVPLVIMTVFATNIGSSATVVGNPIGVLIALRADLTFTDFLQWATPMSLLALVLTIILCKGYYKNYIKELKVEAVTSDSEVNRGRVLDWLIFGGTLGGLILHGPIESLLGLEKGVMLIGVALISAGTVLLISRKRAREIVERNVDWWTLAFFITLFASVGTLKYVGVTKLIAEGFIGMGLQGTGLYLTFGYISGFLTAILDNILAVATLIPVVYELGGVGVNIFPYWWALLFSGTFMGNLTPIGSTANIIALGIVERKHRFSFKEWIKIGAAVSFSTLTLALIIMTLRTGMLS